MEASLGQSSGSRRPSASQIKLTLEIDRHCDDTFSVCWDSGIHALYSLVHSHAFELAALVGVEHYDADAAPRWDARFGAIFKVRSGRLALVVAPSVELPLSNDDSSVDLGTVKVPVTLQYQVTHVIAAYLRSGIGGWLDADAAPLREFAQEFTVPLAAGALINVAHAWDIGAEVSYPYSAGPGEIAGVGSQLAVFAQLRL